MVSILQCSTEIARCLEPGAKVTPVQLAELPGFGRIALQVAAFPPFWKFPFEHGKVPKPASVKIR